MLLKMQAFYVNQNNTTNETQLCSKTLYKSTYTERAKIRCTLSYLLCLYTLNSERKACFKYSKLP